jgi:hypothetical protein
MEPPDCRYCGTSVRGPVRQQQASNDHHAPVWWCPDCERELGNPEIEVEKDGIGIETTPGNMVGIHARRDGDVLTFVLSPEQAKTLVSVLQSTTAEARESIE